MNIEKLTIRVKTEGDGSIDNPFRMATAEILYGGNKLPGLLVQNLVFALSAETMLPMVVITGTALNCEFEFDGPAAVVKSFEDIKNKVFNVSGTPFQPSFPFSTVPAEAVKAAACVPGPVSMEEARKAWEDATGLDVNGPEVAQAVEDLKRKDQ